MSVISELAVSRQKLSVGIMKSRLILTDFCALSIYLPLLEFSFPELVACRLDCLFDDKVCGRCELAVSLALLEITILVVGTLI